MYKFPFLEECDTEGPSPNPLACEVGLGEETLTDLNKPAKSLFSTVAVMSGCLVSLSVAVMSACLSVLGTRTRRYGAGLRAQV